MSFDELRQLQEEVNNGIKEDTENICNAITEFFDTTFDEESTEVYKQAILNLSRSPAGLNNSVKLKFYISFLYEETGNVYLQYMQYDKSRNIGTIVHNKPFSEHWEDNIAPFTALIKEKLTEHGLSFIDPTWYLDSIGGGEAPTVIFEIKMQF